MSGELERDSHGFINVEVITKPGTSNNGHSVKKVTSGQRTSCNPTLRLQLILFSVRENLSTGDKGPVPNLSLVERLHSTGDKGPVPNLSLVERLHSTGDKGPVPNLSLVERLHSTGDKGPVPNLSLVERLHSTGDKGPVPNLSLIERLH